MGEGNGMVVGEEIRNEYLARLRACLAEIPAEFLDEVLDLLLRAHHSGKKIILLGNGGSATTAMHFACDLSKWTVVDGTRRVRALSLVSNAALTTALGNDLGFDSVFQEQLMSLLDPGDVVVGISCSGQSPNVLSAMEWAGAAGAETVALTGFGGGRLKALAKYALILSGHDYMPVEDSHMVVTHMIADGLKRRLHHDRHSASAQGAEILKARGV